VGACITCHDYLLIALSLTNLFNAIPNRSALRPQVYQALLRLATENEELDVLQLKPSDIEKWLDEWDINDHEKSDFIKSVSDAFIKLGQEYVKPPKAMLHIN
jgi:translation initiation factor 3 subunit M